MSFITAGGHRLETKLIAGRDRTKPTLVLLHHGLGCIDLWYDFPDLLAQATGCPVFVYSRHGYGQSDPCTQWPRSPFYMQDEAIKVLPEVLAAAGLNDVILLGHSDGATIALVYAGAVDAQANGVKLCGAVAIAPHFFLEDFNVAAITKIDQTYATTDLKAKMARFHNHVDGMFYGWSKSWLQPDFTDFNTEEFLSEMSAPVLGIQGIDDEYGTMAQMDCLDAKAGGPIEILKIPECGHMAHRDQPARIIEAVTDFTNKLI